MRRWTAPNPEGLDFEATEMSVDPSSIREALPGAFPTAGLNEVLAVVLARRCWVPRCYC